METNELTDSELCIVLLYLSEKSIEPYDQGNPRAKWEREKLESAIKKLEQAYNKAGTPT